MVRLLAIEAQADVNKATTDNGSTPVFIAAEKGHLGVVQFLMHLGHTNVLHLTTVDGKNALTAACHGKHIEICGRLLVSGLAITSPADFQHRLTFTTEVLDWVAERLGCHHRFSTVVLFGMHECSDTVLSMLGGVLEVRVRIAEFLDIQTGSDLRHLRAAPVALRQTIAVNADDAWAG